MPRLPQDDPGYGNNTRNVEDKIYVKSAVPVIAFFTRVGSKN